MNNSSPSIHSLLTNIKSTVEMLIQFRGDTLTTKYGAFERLRSAILAILTHELKQNPDDMYEQLWQLIVHLNANSRKCISLLQDVFHKENIQLSVEQWIDQSVISQCLSQQISFANNNDDLLQHFYHIHAFMRISPFYHAFIICIQTIEQSNPALLINIDPKLSIPGYNPIISINSVPNSSNILLLSNNKDPLIQQRVLHRRIQSDPIFPQSKSSNDAMHLRVASPTPLSSDNHVNIKQVDNIPNISYTESNEYGSYGSSYDSRSDIFDESKQTKYETQHRLSISSDITLIDPQDINFNNNYSSSLTNNGEKLCLIDSNSSSDYSKRNTNPQRTSLFWPKKGQKLDDYIREWDLRDRTDLEKENAHFYFSEAIISAVEQIKFTQQCNKYFGQTSSSTSSILSSCETQHISSSNSSSSPLAQSYTPCDPKLAMTNRENSSNMDVLQSERNSDMTESTSASNLPPNTFEWSNRSSVLSINSQESSAETIALALMDAWKNYKVPTASELFWMIPHDVDLPQKFLPLPDGISIDPSEDYLSNEDGQRILCRGNNKWAPPREQLIFHIHQTSSRQNLLEKQSYLCAGCGRHVEKDFSHRYRYCEYTGKYFCRICHTDKKTFLPCYIITKWDFSNKHSVSNFAFDYLNRISNDPAFNLYDLNPNLFSKQKQLKVVNELRWSLFYLRHYIFTCRFAQEQGCQKMLQHLSAYTYSDPYTYSIQDLFKTKSGDLIKTLEPIVMKLREHVITCELCYAKGFVCEICINEKDVIFPFELQITSVCRECQSCYHLRCHQKKNYCCPKCQRNKNRSSLTTTNESKTSIR